ncbi:TetR/AcrR family transcriptional regulator [Baekduia soli]|uniref:TetR/AcrR family transcriptional regulator n=1 Tax=Baekduia soli TaxID=496014 RepID=A0A5B8UBG0_9ACTN|nr:TetR/AcrR family transcriptional regulator [Baekduia soli]QEC50549.1 TetR/AcrR family transcriptional regulator [Baekduia soli]
MAVARADTDRPRRRDVEVLAAATKVFYERGYADATVQDVADELGILKGSLYYYIKTKEDLLFRLLDEAHEHVETVRREAAVRDDLPPLEKLTRYVRGQVAYSVANLPRVAIYYQDVDRLSAPRLRDIHRRRKAHEVWVVDLIRLAQERGEVGADLDPELLANCMFGALIWLYRWHRPDSGKAPEDVVDHVTRYALAGITGAAVPRPGG